MLITRRQLQKIIHTSLNESILLSLLIGCKSECNLSSIAPELENLKIPPCETQEVYAFENIDWESRSMRLAEFSRLVEALEYTTERRRNAITSGGLSYDDLVVTIKNVPYRLVTYLIENKIINDYGFAEDFGDDELCDLSLYFPLISNDEGDTIVLKNQHYTDPASQHIGGTGDRIGHGTKIVYGDPQCNDDFKAVVANINPKITPDDPGI